MYKVLEAMITESLSVNQMMMYIFLGIFVICLIIEVCTVSLVSVWFCIGALTALGFTFIPNMPFWAELIIFAATSLLFLFILRPIWKKYLQRKISKSNVDELEGQKGKVVSKITSLDGGTVKLHGLIWTAVLENGEEEIEEGEIVKIMAVSGNKLIVKKNDEL